MTEGDVIGTVREFHFEHRILVPHNISGTVTDIKTGSFTVEENICVINDKIPLIHDAGLAGQDPATDPEET